MKSKEKLQRENAGPIEVEIFGRRYQLKGGDPEYVRALARYVDTKMRQIAQAAGNVSEAKAALLAAINITHELFAARGERKEKERDIAKRTRDLIESIDEHFEEFRPND